MIPRPLPRIASLAGASLAGAPAGADDGAVARVVVDVVTDSRRAGPGALFVAIAGERTDGHAHVGQVASAGGAALAVGSVIGSDRVGDDMGPPILNGVHY